MDEIARLAEKTGLVGEELRAFIKEQQDVMIEERRLEREERERERNKNYMRNKMKNRDNMILKKRRNRDNMILKKRRNKDYMRRNRDYTRRDKMKKKKDKENMSWSLPDLSHLKVHLTQNMQRSQSVMISLIRSKRI